MCTPTWKNQSRARRASTRPSTQVKKNVSLIRTNRLRKILLHATTPPSTVHQRASVRELPVIAAAVTVVAATEAAIGKTLAAAAAEDVLDAAAAVAGAVAVAAVAGSVPAVAVTFLLPNTLPRKAANR